MAKCADKVIDPAPIIKKLADRCLEAKGLECSILGDVIDMLRSAPAVHNAPYWATEAAYKNGHAAGKPKWIPLSEQKPGRDDLVLVFFEGMRDTPAAIQVMYGWCIGGSASHWMPLPEPPKEGE